MINTKLTMGASAICLGISGVALTFLPKEISLALSGSASETNTITLQIMGALYFSFAMINWTAKSNLIGGIYGRPIAIGNFTHFIIGCLALIKALLKSPDLVWLWVASPIYLLWTILFTLIIFTHPIPEK